MSDMENAVEGGAEFIAAQQKKVAEDLAKEEAREAAAAAAQGYPRTFDAHTHTVDTLEPWEGTATQYSYNSKAEALAAIDAARAAGKHVVRQDESGYIYEGAGGSDWRVNIED